jgi:hypothetical protein
MAEVHSALTVQWKGNRKQDGRRWNDENSKYHAVANLPLDHLELCTKLVWQCPS